ncbi:MAG: hypothetical protein AAGA09_08340 [Pseudomonadota bacterium]
MSVFTRPNHCRLALALIAATLASACASSQGPKGPPKGGVERGPAAALSQSGRLLSAARKLQEEKGCAAAAPTYRVIASFGDGYEVAQHELGACLLTMRGKSEAEAGLYAREALFWLERAAFAGSARAQHQLAEQLSGAGAASLPADPMRALGWAIVYDNNAARDLYGLKDVAPGVLRHLQASLSATEKQTAQAFAANFEEIQMASFTPPARQRDASGQRGERTRQGPPGGGRRRR